MTVGIATPLSGFMIGAGCVRACVRALLRQGVGQGVGPLGGSLMRRVMIGAGGWGMIGAQPIKARKFKCFAQRALAFQPLHPDVHTVDLELPASSVQI